MPEGAALIGNDSDPLTNPKVTGHDASRNAPPRECEAEAAAVQEWQCEVLSGFRLRSRP